MIDVKRVVLYLFIFFFLGFLYVFFYLFLAIFSRVCFREDIGRGILTAATATLLSSRGSPRATPRSVQSRRAARSVGLFHPSRGRLWD